MVRNWLIKILLLPFAALYGLGISIRNFLYNQNILKAVRFSVPLISIGNIAVGGTGKTPHVEYLIRTLQPYINVGTMSRGYKRKTKGFRMVNMNSTVKEVGDEPLQFKMKFPQIPVSVAESRALGIPDLLGRYPGIEAIILDDAFQHRSVEPFLNILLTTHRNPYFRDFLLPSGRLREWPSGADRADAIIVTKCPTDLTLDDRKEWINALEPTESQNVFFSTLKYGKPYSYFDPHDRLDMNSLDGLVLLSAIANTEDLEDHVYQYVDHVINMAFEDHHNFTPFDVGQIISNFRTHEVENKVVLTTEKDAMRLLPHRNELRKQNIPIYILPIQVRFLFQELDNFDDYVKDTLMKFKA